MNAPAVYNILVVTDSGDEISIPWDSSREWLNQHRNTLDHAVRVTIAPIDVADKRPAVSMQLRPEQRWILFKRAYPSESAESSVQLYCIGFQETVDGRNNKTLLWVYPNGTLEVGTEPTLWSLFL